MCIRDRYEVLWDVGRRHWRVMSGAEGARGTYEGLAGGEIPDVLFLAFVDPRGVYGADLELRSERDRVRIVLVLHVCLVDRCIRAGRGSVGVVP